MNGRVASLRDASASFIHDPESPLTATLPLESRLRAAALADVPRIAPLLAELGYPSSAEETRTRLEHLLASDVDRVLVAEQDGALLAVGSVHRFFGIHDTEPIALITAIVVTERARGSGVGRVLLGALEEVARAWGCRRVLVTSANHRAHAHGFYERRGYELTGRRYAKSLA